MYIMLTSYFELQTNCMSDLQVSLYVIRCSNILGTRVTIASSSIPELDVGTFSYHSLKLLSVVLWLERPIWDPMVPGSISNLNIVGCEAEYSKHVSYKSVIVFHSID